KINIEGTLNAVKNSKIDGNLYFLSSEGLIVGKSGVINAGAFYAMTPTKGFMDKFIGNGDSLDLSRVDNEIGYIVDRKISNHNAAYDYGVTINPYGEIQIEGKINTVNGIGLYAGGFGEGSDANKKGLYIGKDAVLNSLDASGFSSVVNVSGLSLPQATDIVEDGGSIELVSVQDNTHNSSKILELVTGYSSFVTASAAAKIESSGKINSIGDVSLTAYASNGHLETIKKDGTKKKFNQVANIADVYSTVVVEGEINSEGDISVTATSDNINELKTPNLTSLALEMSGTVFKKFPLNVDANVLVSKTSSYVNVKKDAKLEADGAIEVAATTNSSVKAGAKTSSFVTNETALSDFNWLPIVATAINISEAKAVVDFDGKATSKLEDETAPVGEEPKKSISIKAESNSSLSAASKAKTSNSRAGAGIAFALGKHENTAILNIGKNAGFEAKQTIELSSLTTSENSVTSFSSVGKTSYAEPAVSIAIFDSEATANVEGKINVKNQVGTFTFNVVNTIDSDELSADSGITAAQRKWAEASGNVKKAFLNGLYEKLKLSNAIAGAMPAANAAKFSIAGSVAYGGGKHSANINIKPGATIKTTGNLNISSEMNIMDTKYSSTADMACSEEHEGSKFSTSIAFLYNDYDYSSTILIDDSSNPKTEISGKNVSIESTIYQPYRRPEAMYEDLKSAWEKVCEYFDGSTHAALFDKVGRSFDKLFTLVKDPSDMTSAGNAQQAGQVWREVTEAFESLYELIKNEAIVTEDSIVGRLIDSVKAVLEFKEYTNYVNVNVSSSVSTDDAGDDQPFAVSGSVYIGNNKAKSNIFGGKNVIIKSADSADIDISSKSDVTTTTMVGGIPVLYNINSAKSSAGAAVLIHKNNSESNILMANGATIGNAKTGNININTANLFKPIELVMGTSSASSGFNGMASAIDSKSYSNIRLDDGVNLSGDTIKLDAYNNTEATNIVGALTLTEKKGIGVGLAITLMDKESQVLIQDNDQYWQNIRKSKGLSGSTTSSTKVASITADIVKAVAKTTGTINSVGVAGAVAIDDKRHIVHILVADAVACQLETARDGETIVQVPFHTCQIFVAVVIKQLLGVVVPLGLLVEEVMPAHVQTNIVDGAPLGTEDKLCGYVLVDLLAVAELVDGGNLAGLKDRRLVLHADLCLEFILGSEVEAADLVVGTNDGSDAHRRLVTEQVHTLGILL
ncbi:MAG: leukotoxin LktA family filamentous adhesin, partial [Candidatus Riflebacteria bacterium]|nr:leukotoxin LktA family filamentous adhesin [Candidatus Riflebacteria bacterium]